MRADTGIVIQAYLRDSLGDLAQLMEWSTTGSRPIAVRLVKGAYWDAETVLARAHGWPVPVYERKGDTDANFERCTRLLLEHRAGARWTVQPAFASHNVRSVAHAIAVADDLGLPRHDLQFQMLYGMEGGLAGAVRSLGPQVDVYAPVGDLVPGMSYLVRRLLENSSNESFVRQTGRHLDASRLLTAPVPLPRARRSRHERICPPTRRSRSVAGTIRGRRTAFARAVDKQATDARDLDIPAVVGAQRISSRLG